MLVGKAPWWQRMEVSKCTYGIPAHVIAERCGVDLSTARRWKSGRSRVPAAAAALLLRDLGAFSGAWAGWRVSNDGEELVSPDGWRVSRNDALAVPLLHGQIQALRARVKELESLEESQPEPGTWNIQIG